MSEPTPDSTAPDSQGSASQRGLRNWIEQRTGMNGLLQEALDEPIPGGARYAYIFGSGLLFVFLSQVITGVFLALYYVPSADHAHTTVAYIAKEVAAGSFLRSLHVYGSSAMVIIVLLHISQTFLYGSYKGRRELLWLSGTVLFALVMGMAFTGYLLPWDQKAYFATAVGTNVPSEIPVVGNVVKEVMRGGSELGTLTISRFFVAHVLMIPGLIFLFIGTHIFLFRKAGPAGPMNEDSFHPKLPTQSFYPRQLLMDLGLALFVIVILGSLALLYPAVLGPEANPADTQFLPRPEWYYRSLFQWLKLWTGSSVVVGIGVIPLIVVVLFVGLPFIDRRAERRPWKRPLAVGLFALIFGGLIIMEGWSYYADAHDPAVAKQLALQDRQTKEYMQEPFKPERQGAPLPTGPAATAASVAALGAGAAVPDDAVAAGQETFESHACNACHGAGGAGTPMAPKLAGIGKKRTAEQLFDLFNHPTAGMDKGGMPHFQFTQDDVKGLIAYLDSQQ
ncbi:MAG TPA: cytochrome b N-terminal domain-containing protein [Terriglobia bacterium]|nr:cytochrome b N-terminal domain-containing protein [Terriglobia bacterium]